MSDYHDLLICLLCGYDDYDNAFDLDLDGITLLGPGDDTLRCPNCGASQEHIVSADDWRANRLKKMVLSDHGN